MNLARGMTKTKKTYTNDEQTKMLKDLFDQWMGELPNAREITFKPNMDNFTVFVVYDEVVEDGDWNGY